jgi:geranylgeranyl pyrophosphate synthase
MEYLKEGHALLKRHGLYRSGSDMHTFAMDRALANACAAEIAASAQALHEAGRLITPRGAIAGKRIILGDYFMSLAVKLCLPLRNKAVTDLLARHMSLIGSAAQNPFFRNSRQDFLRLVDEFCMAATQPDAGRPASGASAAPGESSYFDTKSSAGPREAWPRAEARPLAETQSADQCKGRGRAASRLASMADADLAQAAASPPARIDNTLLFALDAGFYKSASAEARRALYFMEKRFSERFRAPEASEMDGWIHSALTSGGKRLRPILVCLSAGLGPGGGDPDEELVVRLMATIELMHCASLVHDDIVDRSPTRRSRATINAEKGDGYAAMCGFAMIGEALNLLGDADIEDIPAIIARIPLEMSFGELRQLDVEYDLEAQTEADYYERIGWKTATLIEGSCMAGALATGADAGVLEAVREYGHALGILFQLRDDLLDYALSPTDGKPVSQDMERGIYSLPLLHALECLPENTAAGAKLRSVLKKRVKSRTDIFFLVETANQTGGIGYARKMIEKEAGRAADALSRLQANEYTEALALILDALNRKTETEARALRESMDSLTGTKR